VLAFIENAFLFNPAPASRDWKAPPNDRVRDVELRLTDGTLIHGWWCPPRGWQPEHGALLHCHGNSGNLSHRGPSAEVWQETFNVPVLLFDYPGYGKSSGRPSERGCYASADAMYDWLVNEQRVSPERMLIYGGSLGGAVAVDVASRRPHRGLVLVSTFASVPAMADRLFRWFPAGRFIGQRFDSLSKIERCRKPVFFAHGTADRVVPIAQSEMLFARASEPKELFRMEGLDHNHTPRPEFYPRLRDFLSRNEAR
jgi:fermentation-respiration switch protein FrsA (DUF1100 family)